jgi:hypothetical protein
MRVFTPTFTAVRVIVTESSASGFRVICYDDSAPGRDGLFPRIGQRILNLRERRVLVSSGETADLRWL